MLGYQENLLAQIEAALGGMQGTNPLTLPLIEESCFIKGLE